MDTGTFVGKFISFFTMCRYSHVAISLDKKCDITYSFGRRNIYSIFNGGFVSLNKDQLHPKSFHILLHI